MEAQPSLGDSTGVVGAHFDMAFPFPLRAVASMEETGSYLVVAAHENEHHGSPMAEQNGCRQRLEGYLSCHRRFPLAVD